MAIMDSFQNIALAREMTGPLLLVSMFSSFGGMSYGIDNAYWGGILGMKKFAEDFGYYDPSTSSWAIPTTWQSVGSGTPAAGVAIGCLVSQPLSQSFGRKRCFLILSALALVGILVQVTAFNYWQILVGRIVNSISMGIICNVIPTYQAECAPASIRGAAINFYQFWLLFGALLSTIINYACSSRDDQWAYRTIILVQIIIPVSLFASAFFLPDSPRWLLAKGREAEATKIMVWLRKGTPVEVVHEEVRLIKAANEREHEQHYAATYLDCFRGTNRRRTMIAIGVQSFQQLQGSSFITNYIYIFLEDIGIKDTYEIGIYLYLINLVSAGAAFWLADRFGRRPLMALGGVIQTLMMFIVGGLAGVDGATTQGQKNGALAALFIWLAIQAFAWGSCVWITSSEVATLQLREKTLSLATFCGFVWQIIIIYVNPYLENAGYGNLQGEVGFVYGGLSFLSILFVIFYLPELKNRSLEELDELFQKRVSVFKFGSYKTDGIGSWITTVEHKGTGAEVLDGKEVGHIGTVEVEAENDISEKKADV